jgi:PAS domain S-box-containing protein
MGEKVTPAASSPELPRVETPRDPVEVGVPPILTQISNSISHQAPAPAPANGNAADVPRAVEKAYFEQLIENAPEAISIIDQDVRILRVNGEFTRMFGFSSAEAAGKRLDQLIVPPDRYAETAWIGECMKTQDKLALETRRQRKDGSLVEVLPTPPIAISPSRSVPRN